MSVLVLVAFLDSCIDICLRKCINSCHLTSLTYVTSSILSKKPIFITSYNVVKLLYSSYIAFVLSYFWQGWLLQTDCMSAFMVYLAKIFLTCSLITIQNLVTVSRTVSGHIGGLEYVGAAGPCALGMGCRWPYRNMLLPMRYYTEVCCSRSNRLVGDPQKLGDTGALPLRIWGMADPIETCLCYHAKFSNSRSKHTNLTIEILQKKLTPHSRSLKLQGHWNQHGSIGYLSLPISGDPQ